MLSFLHIRQAYQANGSLTGHLIRALKVPRTQSERLMEVRLALWKSGILPNTGQPEGPGGSFHGWRLKMFCGGNRR